MKQIRILEIDQDALLKVLEDSIYIRSRRYPNESMSMKFNRLTIDRDREEIQLIVRLESEIE